MKPPLPKILFHSNFHKQLTGFGKNAKNVLSFLFSTGKYEIVELANGYKTNDPNLSFSPWRTIGTLAEDKEVSAFIGRHEPAQQETAKKRVFYGDTRIHQIIEEEKPDIYISVEDVWAMAPYANSSWWNKINCVVWTTLDSLPILPDAVNLARQTPNYWIWSDFATQELHKMGLKHVKTIHGAVKTEDFYPLSKEEKIKIRLKNGIDTEFVAGFVFRNQARKSVYNLLEAVAALKKKRPELKPKALIVTNWAEGWPIQKFIQEYGLETSDVLTPHVCKKCSGYQIHAYSNNAADCKNCGEKGSCSTVNIAKGLTEKQLNEVYSVMDVYCHPFTSGGQEIPIQEAKLTELITLVTDYSCGVEGACAEGGGIPLKWSATKEFGSCFTKAVTDTSDLIKKIEMVADMPEKQRISTGKIARQYVIDNYSIKSVCEKIMVELDKMPKPSYFSSRKTLKLNPSFIPQEGLSDQQFLLSIYNNMLGEEPQKGDPNFGEAIAAMSRGEERENVIYQFRQEAIKRENEMKPKTLQFTEPKEKRVGIICGSALKFCVQASKKIQENPSYISYIFCPEDVGNIFPHSENVKVIKFDKTVHNQSYMNEHFCLSYVF